MEAFIGKDFLLDTDTARQLYHGYAAHMPIIDYHCHLDPQAIWENRQYDNIAQVWLGGDHYKWRLLRANGVEERWITGDAPDREKFQKFAETLPRALGNPVYQWCHLELRQYFGYTGVLNGDTAQTVWDLTRERLHTPDMRARSLITAAQVAMIGTTDDPCSDLRWQEKLAADPTFAVQVCPTFRPDPAFGLEKPDFAVWMERLGRTAGVTIRTTADVCRALDARMAFFAAHGCRAADHGLARVVYRPGDEAAADRALARALAGAPVPPEEADAYVTQLLLHCARAYAQLGWAMQLHFGCIRNPNSRMMARLGPDTGFDCMGVTDSCGAAARLLDALNRTDSLPRTILYSLNPADNAWIDTLAGSFQSAEIPGKIQHGAAWWFNDHKTGITDYLTSLASQGLLGNCIGMVTDSRSLLSYARHGYFRRVLCGLLGRWAENGEVPADPALLGGLVHDVCFRNARRYFGL